jgi:hypothetical protein
VSSIKLPLATLVLVKKFGPKRDYQEVRGNCTMRSFIIFAFHQHIIREIKLRGMRCAGIVAPMSEMRNPYKILVGNHERKGPFT